MKRLFALLLVLGLFVSSWASTEIENPTKLFEIAQKGGHNIIIVFTATWCGWCHKLKTETLKDTKVEKLISENILINMDFDKNAAFRKRFGITGVPATIFLNSHLKEIDRIIGYLPPKEFIKEYKRIKSGKDTFMELLKYSSKNCIDPKKHLALAEKYSERNMNKKAIEQYQLALNYGISGEKAYYGMGLVYKDMKNYNTAIKFIKKAIKMSKPNLKMHYNLMLCYYYNQNFSKCIKECNNIISLDKNNKENMNPLAFYVKVLCFHKMGMVKDARRNFEYLSDFFPKNRYTQRAIELFVKGK